MADLAAARAHLAEARRAEVAAIHRHHRRALGAAVALQRANAERIFEGQRDALRQFLRAHQNILQAAEALRRAAAHVGLQKGRRGDQEGHAVPFHQLADDLRVQRVGMVDHAHAVDGGHPQRGHESEGVKERQDAEDLVASAQHEDLRDLLDV